MIGRSARCRVGLKTARLLAAVAAIAAAVAAVPAAAGPSCPSEAVGLSVIDMRLFDLAGRRHSIAEARQPHVVLVFWAFWCDTWKKALPSLRALAAEGRDLGFEIWAVSVDGRFTAEAGPLLGSTAGGTAPFPVLLDDGTWARRLGIRHVPTVLVLDRDRWVAWIHEGYPGNAKLRQAILHASKAASSKGV